MPLSSSPSSRWVRSPIALPSLLAVPLAPVRFRVRVRPRPGRVCAFGDVEADSTRLRGYGYEDVDGTGDAGGDTCDRRSDVRGSCAIACGAAVSGPPSRALARETGEGGRVLIAGGVWYRNDVGSVRRTAGARGEIEGAGEGTRSPLVVGEGDRVDAAMDECRLTREPSQLHESSMSRG